MRRIRTVAALALMLGVLAVAAPGSANETETAFLDDLRELTARFHSVKQAERAGYIATDACVAAPGLGGMGFHYVKPSLVDTTLDPDNPEVLLYQARPNGTHQLTGVEYLVIDADQNLGTSTDRPTLAGHAFDGPMPGHEPGMPIHYDLHVWAWTENPSGDFATWNPAITCP